MGTNARHLLRQVEFRQRVRYACKRFYGVFLVLSPITNVYSRPLEASADRYALAATGKPDAFASMLTRLTDQNLDVSRPARWVEILFYDHPPHYRRVAVQAR